MIDAVWLFAEERRLHGALGEAGRLALSYFGNSPRQWEKRPDAFVTEADIAIDRLLYAALAEGRPEIGWLSEEGDHDPPRTEAPLTWIVDPIDGTRGFIEGDPAFAITAALLADGRPVLAAILVPTRSELFSARTGDIARLDGRPIRVSARTTIAGGRVHASARHLKRHGRADMLADARLVYGASLACRLAEVACGRADALVSLRRTWDWDIAAADLLIAAAGGVLSDTDGETPRYGGVPPRQEGVLAAPPALHGELLDRLRRVP